MHVVPQRLARRAGHGIVRLQEKNGAPRTHGFAHGRRMVAPFCCGGGCCPCCAYGCCAYSCCEVRAGAAGLEQQQR